MYCNSSRLHTYWPLVLSMCVTSFEYLLAIDLSGGSHWIVTLSIDGILSVLLDSLVSSLFSQKLFECMKLTVLLCWMLLSALFLDSPVVSTKCQYLLQLCYIQQFQKQITTVCKWISYKHFQHYSTSQHI